MDSTTVIACAFLIGVVTGLRSMTAPAAVSWAAHFGWLHLSGTPLAFLGAAVTPYIISLLAAGELVADKLPRTPSRKSAGPFAGRVIIGGLCGAALTLAAGHSLVAGILAGAVGGVAGTLGGHAARAGLVKAIGGTDWPIAVGEDLLAIGSALFLVTRFS